MSIPLSDLTLGSDELAQRYTKRELEETLNLIDQYGGVANYARVMSGESLGAKLAPSRSPADMDVLSPEYLGGMAKNIPSSAYETGLGAVKMLMSPVESAQNIYDAGVSGIFKGLGERYGTPDEWASGDFSKAKTTAFQDPFGVATEVAPGLGILGRGAKAAGMGKALGTSQAANRVRNTMRRTLPYVENPTKILKDSAVWGAKQVSSKMASVGLFMLEFSTGQSVQSLRAMMEAGALTNAQKAAAGTNFYKHIFGEFDIGDKYSAKAMQAIREGKDPSLGVELLTDSGEGVLSQIDIETPRQLFRDAQKDLAGTVDEARIFGHVVGVQNKISERLLGSQQQLQRMLAEDLAPSPEVVKKLEASGADYALGPKGEEWLARNQKSIMESTKAKLDRVFAEAGWGITGNRIVPALGTAITETEGFSEFSKYIVKLRDNLVVSADLPVVRTVHNPAQRVNELVKYISGDVNDGLMSLGTMVDTFENAASPIQRLSRKTETILREMYTDLYNVAGKSDKAAKLTQYLDGHKKLNSVVDELMLTFKAYRTGKGSKSDALDTWMSALENDSLRKGFIDDIENYTGHSLSAPIAGLIARRVTPKSLVARGSAVSAAQRAIPAVGAAAYTGSPLFLAWLPFTSPKFVGNVLMNLGMKQRFVDYMKAVSRHMHQHPVGKSLAEVDGTIFSMYTALDHIQRYNQQQDQQNTAGIRSNVRTNPQTTSQFDLPGSSKTKGQKNLNPLNNKFSNVAAQYAKKDARGNPMRDNEGHLIYPNAEAGWRGGLADLQAKFEGKTKYGLSADSTLAQLGNIWAEHKGWARGVSSISGYGLTTKLKDMDLMTLARAMARQEGWYVQ